MAVSVQVNSAVLKRIVRCLADAAASRPDMPTHFTETVLIQPDSAGVAFLCTDGYRLHKVVVSTSYAKFDGDGDQLIVGVAWLLKMLHSSDDEYFDLTITGEAHPEASRLVNIWRVEIPGYGAQEFDIGGRWPSLHSLIDYDVVEYGAGFNPAYFKDMIDAAMIWWDRKDPDDAFPLIVKQMHPQKQSSFTIRNSLGTLSMTLMPKVIDSDEV